MVEGVEHQVCEHFIQDRIFINFTPFPDIKQDIEKKKKKR